MRPVTVALCQFRPAKGRPSENLARIEVALRAMAGFALAAVACALLVRKPEAPATPAPH